MLSAPANRAAHISHAMAFLLSTLTLTAQAIEEPAYTIEQAWEAEQIEIAGFAEKLAARRARQR